MNFKLVLTDVRNMLASKRATYTIVMIAVFAIGFALVVEFSPEGLKTALENAKPEESAGLFEYLWFEDVLKFLLLAVVSFGAFIISDLEDVGALELTLARPESRLIFLTRRVLSSLISFLIIFFTGILTAGVIAWSIVGGLDLTLFIAHHLMIMPMLLFVFSLTFFFSVPLRTTTYTVISAFAFSLMLSFIHTFSMMDNPGSEPTILNPLAFGYRVMTGQPLAEGFFVLLSFTAFLFIAGGFWFIRKDL